MASVSPFEDGKAASRRSPEPGGADVALFLHAARDLVVAGVPVAVAARQKGISRGTLRGFLAQRVV